MGIGNIETVVVAVLLAATLLPLLAIGRRFVAPHIARLLVALWLLVPLVFIAVTLATRTLPVPEHEVAERPIAVLEEGYASSDTCQACHPSEYRTWKASYHRTMTQVASPETVKGDFDDVTLELDGRTYHLTESEGSFWVEHDAPGVSGTGPAKRITSRVVLTTGSHHDQDYWLEVPGEDRRLVLLPFDFKVAEQRWVPYRNTFIVPPKSLISEAGEWNKVCVTCHAVRGQKRIERQGRDVDFDTTVTEFGIACESCHGPALEHVEHFRAPMQRFSQYLGGSDVDDIVNPAKLDSKRSSEICGACHGIFIARDDPVKDGRLGFESDPYQPGDDIHESRIYIQHHHFDRPLAVEDERERRSVQRLLDNQPDYERSHFWSDGMVRVSGRDFSGLMKSPCYQRGDISCTSCHQLHKSGDDPRTDAEWANDQLAVGMDGNEACTQCHARFEDIEVAMAHSHHEAGSSGNECMNCHMPFTVYGLQKAIRSHLVDSPDVATSVATGRPNACNQCHLDQPLGWTSVHLAEWYGKDSPALTPDEESIAAGALLALSGDAGQRALMAWSMGWDAALEASGSAWMMPILGQLLADPYPSVRFIAMRTLREREGFEDFEYDFSAPDSDLQDAVFRARMIWSGRSGEGRSGGLGAVLHDPQGYLDHWNFDRLLEKRDDRPLYLME